MVTLERKQKLIHLHTSESDIARVIGSVELGEIVVKHNTTTPELYIKKDDGTAATFIDNVAIEALITAASTELTETINGVSEKVTELSGNVEYFQTTVAETYATKDDVANDIATAKSEAIASANSYTDTQIAVLDGLIDGVDDKVIALTQTVADNKAAVDAKFEGYYTSAQTDSKIEAAMKSATDASSAYTDTKVQAATTALTENINGVSEKVTELSGVVKTHIENVATKFNDYYTSAETDTKIAAAMKSATDASSAYTDAKVQAATTALTENINGVKSKVDTLIGEDSGKTARSIAVEEVAKIVADAPEAFDTLVEIAEWIGTASGTSAATLVADIEALKKADEGFSSGLTTTNSNVTALSGSVESFQTTVAETYATKTGVTADIATAKSEAIASANSYTDSQIEVVNSAITSIDSRLQDVEDLNSTVLNAILDIEVTGFGDAITATVEDHKATLDLSSITIDCGTF